MVVSIVRFTSKLSADEVQTKFEDRADSYRHLPGLVEKIYVRFRDTGEFGAVYVWESDDALARFRESELARSIPDAYRVEGAAEIELADVSLVVRPDLAPAPTR
ncbi:MAG: YdhR family protein [Gaiellaceae bacterium]